MSTAYRELQILTGQNEVPVPGIEDRRPVPDYDLQAGCKLHPENIELGMRQPKLEGCFLDGRSHLVNGLAPSQSWRD